MLASMLPTPVLDPLVAVTQAHPLFSSLYTHESDDSFPSGGIDAPNVVALDCEMVSSQLIPQAIAPGSHPPVNAPSSKIRFFPLGVQCV